VGDLNVHVWGRNDDPLANKFGEETINNGAR
jgi:hypothetical protein